MLIQIERIDVSRQVSERQQPVMMLKRELPGNDGVRRIIPSAAKLTSSEPWWILQHRLPGDKQPHWALDKSSSHVRVPLFDYILGDPAIETLVHFGAQTGALAAAMVPRDKPVRKLLVVIGNVFQRPDNSPGYQVWAGYAFCLEKE